MSGVASPVAPARRDMKSPRVTHDDMVPEEKGHDRSIPMLGGPIGT